MNSFDECRLSPKTGSSPSIGLKEYYRPLGDIRGPITPMAALWQPNRLNRQIPMLRIATLKPFGKFTLIGQCLHLVAQLLHVGFALTTPENALTHEHVQEQRHWNQSPLG